MSETNAPTLKDVLDHLNAGQELIFGSALFKVMASHSQEALRITAKLNSGFHSPEEIIILMSELTGQEIDKSFRMFPPFYSDFGKNIHIGKNVFINSCCCFQDQGGIFIGDGAFIGHRATLATLNHGFTPETRPNNIPKPIHIGANVWLGASVTITPGVSIGANSIIAAGAVVTKNIPGNVIAAGVPAKVLKKIPDAQAPGKS